MLIDEILTVRTYIETTRYRLRYDTEHPKFFETINLCKEANGFTEDSEAIEDIVFAEIRNIYLKNKGEFNFEEHGIELTYLQGDIERI